MLLSDGGIRAEIENGRVGVDPRRRHGPAVEHRRASRQVLPGVRRTTATRSSTCRPSRRELTRMVESAPEEPFILHPGEFVLASTTRSSRCPTISPGDWRVSRRWAGSACSPTRRPVHRPGLLGARDLELSNVATLPIKLWPGMKIGQLCLFRLESRRSIRTARRCTDRGTRGQRGPTPSRSISELPPHADRLSHTRVVLVTLAGKTAAEAVRQVTLRNRRNATRLLARSGRCRRRIVNVNRQRDLPGARRPFEAEAIWSSGRPPPHSERPVLLYSIGKDSTVLLHLARKAFHPGPIPSR